MDRFDRIYQLHGILSMARRPVARQALEERLACSRATVKRTIEAMRDYLQAPIEYDRRANGYYYDSHDGGTFELPGLWFNHSELHALLTVQHLIDEVQPGLLGEKLAPLRARIQQLLADERIAPGDIGSRVRILRQAARSVPGDHFQVISDALIQHRQLQIRYHARASDEFSDRTVSPQRLVHYRDNWYLDAWCHQRKALRSFSLDRIRNANMLDSSAREIPERQLDTHFATGYGIFAGRPKATAILQFTPHAARWAAEEQWHPEQQSAITEDGGYRLEFPYADPRELVREILKWGAEVKVLEPVELRREVAERLRAALNSYGEAG